MSNSPPSAEFPGIQVPANQVPRAQFHYDMARAPASLAVARARLAVVAKGLPVVHLKLCNDPTRLPPEAVVLADHVLYSSSPQDVDRLAVALKPAQVLIFLEPTADVGWRHWLQRTARPLWARLLGHHFDSDVPAMLRSTGLTVTDTVRFGLGPAAMFSYVYGRAEWISVNRPVNG